VVNDTRGGRQSGGRLAVGGVGTASFLAVVHALLYMQPVLNYSSEPRCLVRLRMEKPAGSSIAPRHRHLPPAPAAVGSRCRHSFLS
jgi:hypothetical protein